MPNKIKLKIIDKRVTSNMLPKYATSGSAAMDLRVLLDEPCTIKPGECQLLKTGIAIYLENPSYAALIIPRSGMAHKRGLVLGNSLGLIDSDYQGELMISCWNRGNQIQTIAPNDRLAQIIIVPVVAQAEFEIVDEFKSTERGEGGYGHTDIK